MNAGCICPFVDQVAVCCGIDTIRYTGISNQTASSCTGTTKTSVKINTRATTVIINTFPIFECILRVTASTDTIIRNIQAVQILHYTVTRLVADKTALHAHTATFVLRQQAPVISFVTCVWFLRVSWFTIFAVKCLQIESAVGYCIVLNAYVIDWHQLVSRATGQAVVVIGGQVATRRTVGLTCLSS